MNSQQQFYARLNDDLAQTQKQGLLKTERQISSRQGTWVQDEQNRQLINLCANNYLGLSGQQELVDAAKDALDRYGYGLSSVRFICGTQTVHKALEKALSDFLGQEDTILFPSAFDANGGVFEALLGEQDVVISDALNHASIIDGIRLCRAQRLRYAHNDMQALEEQLQGSATARTRLIVTDGVFSMDGTIAQLDKICALAQRYDALVMIDECHASGFMGKTGRGTHEHHDVVGKIDIITGTLGKALGGAMGGFVSARAGVVNTLRQKARPYLFSNSLAPVIAATSLHVIELLSRSSQLRDQLQSNTDFFRAEIQKIGFTIAPGSHPIVPIMLFEAELAQKFAARLYEQGIFVTGFFYPVVPIGKARIRVQISAGHTREQLNAALEAFAKTGKELGVIA